MTGYNLEEVVGQTPRLLKSGRYDEAFYKQMWKTLLDGQVWHGEMVNRSKDGGLYTGRADHHSRARRENQITHFIAIKQDIRRPQAGRRSPPLGRMPTTAA